MAQEFIVNLSDPKAKAMILAHIRELQGPHRIEWCRHRPRRTDRQNRLYWPVFVQPFGDYLREQGHEFTDEMAHAVFKEMFLKETVIDQNTGQMLTFTRSTTELSTTEFNEYLDKCAAFLANDCGFRVPEPSQYREQEELAHA